MISFNIDFITHQQSKQKYMSIVISVRQLNILPGLLNDSMVADI